MPAAQHHQNFEQMQAYAGFVSAPGDQRLHESCCDRIKQRTLFSRTGQDNKGQLERLPEAQQEAKNTASLRPLAARR